MYLSAVIEENWVCRGLFCVGPTRNVGQDLATFGDVGDMSATCRRHVELSHAPRVIISGRVRHVYNVVRECHRHENTPAVQQKTPRSHRRLTGYIIVSILRGSAMSSSSHRPRNVNVLTWVTFTLVKKVTPSFSNVVRSAILHRHHYYY